MGRPPTQAALAAIPRRAGSLAEVLASLRPQVGRLCVYLNGFGEVPGCVQDLADDFVLDPDNGGAERKFWWVEEWSGIHLTCDDDFVYPPEYVDTMVAAVAQWHGRAICSAHGRTYLGDPEGVHDIAPRSRGVVFYRVPEGRWVNHCGTGVMAWDTRHVPIPRDWPERNMADMQVAVWAQRHRVPIWLVPHKSNWLVSLASLDPSGIFRTSQRERHRSRNRVLRAHGKVPPGWVLQSSVGHLGRKRG